MARGILTTNGIEQQRTPMNNSEGLPAQLGADSLDSLWRLRERLFTDIRCCSLTFVVVPWRSLLFTDVRLTV
jgi:hypothetical protein